MDCLVTSRDLIARLKAIWVRRVRKGHALFQDRYGLAYALEPTDDHAFYFRHRGWFEIGEQEFCRRYLKAGMTVVDVGAYIGIYTCLMAKLVEPSGHVHAFEPSAKSFARLQGNIARNRLTNVIANCQAVGSEQGQRHLFSYAPPFESLSSLVRPEVSRHEGVLKPGAQEVVEVVNLDWYCTDRSIDRIDLLKLDAEGAELEVLKGASGLLQREKIGAILFEVGQGSEHVEQCLTEHGFHLFAVAPDGSVEAASTIIPMGHANGLAIHRSAPVQREALTLAH